MQYSHYHAKSRIRCLFSGFFYSIDKRALNDYAYLAKTHSTLLEEAETSRRYGGMQIFMQKRAIWSS